MRSRLLSVHSVFFAALLAAMTSAVSPAEQAGSGYWERLRATGRAIVDDLRARAKPRWQPDDDRTWGGASRRDVDRNTVVQYRDQPVPRSASWEPPAADGPRFSRIIIDRRGALSVEGRGTPGVEVELLTKARVLGQARSDRNGEWRMAPSDPLNPGVYEIRSLAKPTRGPSVSGAEVRISIPDRITDDIVVAFNGELSAPTRNSVRAQAERMAQHASERFSQIVPRPDTPTKPVKPDEGEDAQVVPTPESSRNPILRWLERSARAYQSTVIRRLEKQEPPPVQPPREVVTPKVDQPSPEIPRAAQVEPVAPPPDTTDQAVAEQRRLADEAAERAAEERRRLQAQSRADADAKRRQQEAAASQARIAEEQKKAEELKRSEEQRRTEAKRLADEAARKKAETKRLADEASRAARQRQAEEEATRRATEAAARQAKKAEQDVEAEQIAADVKRRKEESREGVQSPVDAGSKASRDDKARPTEPDARTAEGSTEDAGEAVRANKIAERPRKCRGPKIRYIDGRRMYLVRPGDTLWTIAERFYGDGVLFPIVYNANRELLSDPDVIIDCKRLYLPKRKNVDPADLVIHEAMTTIVPDAPAAKVERASP